MSLRKIELRTAWAWMCPNCGGTLYQESEVFTPTGEELDTARASLGLDVINDADVVFHKSPLRVKHCGETFHAIADGVPFAEIDDIEI